MDEVQMLKRKLERERKARKQAEAILEEKALQLFKLNEELEHKIAKRTEELRISEEKYRGIIENMELGLLEVDIHQNIIKAYDWFCDMTGYTEEELIGQNAKAFLLTDQEDRKLNEAQHKKRERGQAGVYELQIKHKDGHNIWVLISGSPVYDTNGNVIGSLGIHYDITKRKKLEQDLVEAKKGAEAAQEAQKQFLAKMSHEIRTPLNAIIGMSYLLKDSKPTEEQKEYLSILGRSADILKLLISDILDFSKIQAGAISVKESEFNVWTLVESLRKTTQLKVGHRDILVTCDIDPKIRTLLLGDELLLNQILINLLGNAVKFTQKGEIRIFLKVVADTQKHQTIQFQVADTGIGIPENKIGVIFNDFKQANDDIQHEYGGTGLGLSITKQLVELQGGTISVESKVNDHTTFSVTLRYEKAGPIKPKQASKEKTLPKHFESIELLIAEDNLMNQKYIGLLLKKWGIRFEFANDGLEALEKAFIKPYPLIFMDISMPNMNGYDAAEAIRNVDNPNQQTPIIALSAMAFTDDKEKALEIGMTDFLGKPFEPNALLAVLDQYIQRLDQFSIANQTCESMDYPAPLDSAHLNLLYEDDYEYASEMFEIFLNNTVPLFLKIQTYLDEEAFEKVQKTAHQLKPNFSMVGLLELKEQVEKMEIFSEDENKKDEVRQLYQKCEKSLKKALPAIMATAEQLNKSKTLTQLY